MPLLAFWSLVTICLRFWFHCFIIRNLMLIKSSYLNLMRHVMVIALKKKKEKESKNRIDKFMR